MGLKRLVLLTVSLGLALVIAEAALRLFGVSPELLYRPDPWIGWGHYADNRFRFTTEGQTVDVAINSKGLRDIEHAYEKPPGKSRILVLGDSFMEALQVPLEQAFSRALERELREVGRDVNVINAGTSGYGTDNELLFYRHEGRRYEPDLVLLAFCLYNDVRNNWHELERIEVGGPRKPHFTLGSHGLVPVAYPFDRPETMTVRVKLWLNRNVRSYALVRILRDELRHRRVVAEAGMPLDFSIYRAAPPPDWETAWKVTEALLARLRDEVGADGSELWVMPIPSLVQVDSEAWSEARERYPELLEGPWDLEAPNRRLTEILDRLAIPSVELLATFRDVAKQEAPALYLRSDEHWTAAGHLLAARLTRDALVR